MIVGLTFVEFCGNPLVKLAVCSSFGLGLELLILGLCGLGREAQ